MANNQDEELLWAKADIFEEMRTALGWAQGVFGMHGPCHRLNCKDCKAAYRKITEAVRKADSIVEANQ